MPKIKYLLPSQIKQGTSYPVFVDASARSGIRNFSCQAYSESGIYQGYISNPYWLSVGIYNIKCAATSNSNLSTVSSFKLTVF